MPKLEEIFTTVARSGAVSSQRETRSFEIIGNYFRDYFALSKRRR